MIPEIHGNQIDSFNTFQQIDVVLEADIRGFFDKVNHEWLMKFLEHDIDLNFLKKVTKYIIR